MDFGEIARAVFEAGPTTFLLPFVVYICLQLWNAMTRAEIEAHENRERSIRHIQDIVAHEREKRANVGPKPIPASKYPLCRYCGQTRRSDGACDSCGAPPGH